MTPRQARSTVAILVVKGAGLQRHGDTLDRFVRNFWPAVRSLDPSARLRSSDPITPRTSSDGDESAPEAETHFVITTEHCRVVVREVNWEVAVRPESPFTAIRDEWEMASCVLRSRAADAFVSATADEDAHPGLAAFPRLARGVSAFQRSSGSLGSYFCLFLIALMVRIAPDELETALWAIPLALSSATIAWLPVWLFELDRAQATRNGRAADSSARSSAHSVAPDSAVDQPTTHPVQPRPSIALLVMLAVVFVLEPSNYILILAVVLAWAAAVIGYAATCRLPHCDAAAPERTVPPELRMLANPGFTYRLTVVVGLPVMGLVWGLARLLNWIPATRALGRGLADVASRVLSGIMGDVASYARDPTRAARIRGTLEREIERLHQDHSVACVHVVAHSQGTALAFECLYDSLHPKYRRRLRTFITLGSPLGFYHAAEPVMDRFAMQRFPGPTYPRFPNGYRWFNFWSFSDPITEFSGLPEYAFPAGVSPGAQAAPAGPRSIETRVSLRNHTAYWHDYECVMYPLAKRVLLGGTPPEWEDSDRTGDAAAEPSRVRSTVRLALSYALAFVALATVVYLARGVGEFLGPRIPQSIGLPATDVTTADVGAFLERPWARVLLHGAVLVAYAASVTSPWIGRVSRATSRQRAINDEGA